METTKDLHHTSYVAGYMAGMQEQASVLENHIVALERVRAVLLAGTSEVTAYRQHGAFRDEYAVLLLHAADSLLLQTLPELKAAVDSAYKEATA